MFLGDDEAQLVDEVVSAWSLSRYRFGGDAREPSMVWRLERELESRMSARHCIAMNSGTSALYAALAALDIGPGAEVVVPGYTFVASIAAIFYRGATPVLAEVDDSLTLDPEDVESRITSRTRAILAVHMLGAPSALGALASLADEHGLFLVEDCAQACGATYDGRPVGTVGDCGAFSLNIYKTITSGVGGFLLCADDSVYERAFAVHDHGFVPVGMGCADSHDLLGLNFRMNELSAAVALGQARKLPAILKAMRRRKAALVEAIGEVPQARRRRLHDPDGECGSVLVYLFDDAGRARAVADSLETVPLVDSGRHYYGNMAALERATGIVCRRGTLPRTDDLLARSVAISVGVRDTYLGTGFGVDVMAEEPELERTAERFREAANAYA